MKVTIVVADGELEENRTRETKKKPVRGGVRERHRVNHWDQRFRPSRKEELGKTSQKKLVAQME